MSAIDPTQSSRTHLIQPRRLAIRAQASVVHIRKRRGLVVETLHDELSSVHKQSQVLDVQRWWRSRARRKGERQTDQGQQEERYSPHVPVQSRHKDARNAMSARISRIGSGTFARNLHSWKAPLPRHNGPLASSPRGLAPHPRARSCGIARSIHCTAIVLAFLFLSINSLYLVAVSSVSTKSPPVPSPPPDPSRPAFFDPLGQYTVIARPSEIVIRAYIPSPPALPLLLPSL